MAECEVRGIALNPLFLALNETAVPTTYPFTLYLLDLSVGIP